MCEDLSVQEEFRDLTRSRVSNFVVREIELRDCFIQHEVLDQYRN